MRRICVRTAFWATISVLLTAEVFATNTITDLEPTDDTYVRGGSYSENNYNSQAAILRIKNGSGDTYDRQSLLRFDLSSINGTLVQANLNLYCSDLSNGTPGAAFVYSVADDSWQEETVTWNTAPAPVMLLASQSDINAVGVTYTFDITEFVAQELAADGLVSILIRDDLQVNKMVDFVSREGSHPPTLTVETETQTILTVTPTGAGHVVLDPPGGVYDLGTLVSLTAIADLGWRFDSWAGDLSGSVNPDTVTMNADKTIQAVFQLQRVLSVSVNGLGTVTLDPPGGLYDSGTAVTLTATAASGWSFDRWSGGVDTAVNPYVVTITADTAVTATFDFGPVPNGQVSFQEDKVGTASSSNTVVSGPLLGVDGHLYLAAVASRPFETVTSVSGLGLPWMLVDEQCSGRGTTGISLWMAQGQTSVPGGVTAQLAATADEAVIVVAHYAGVDTTLPLDFQVAANTNGSSGACSGGSDGAAYGLTVNPGESGSVMFGVVAHGNPQHTPGSGWTERQESHTGPANGGASVSFVDRESGGAGALLFDGTFSAAADWAAVAIELRPAPEFALDLTTTGLGTVAMSPPGGYYSVDTIVSLTPTAAPDWHFVEWSGDINGHANPMSVLMNDGVKVSAVFSLTPHHDLNVAVNGIGNVAIDPPAGRYALGTPVTATVEIPPGWLFTGWQGDLSGKAPAATVIMNADRDVIANFTFVAQAPTGLWSSAEELLTAPLQGAGWNAVTAAADASFFPPDVSDAMSPHNIRCLAAAIAYARTGQSTYHNKVTQALDYLSTVGNPGSSSLAWARELGAYALAADLIGYQNTDFDNWLRNMVESYLASDGRTLEEAFHQRPNNWGTHAFGALVAVYAYLHDDVKLNAVRDYWIQLVNGSAPEAVFGELSWHQNPVLLRTINPPGAVKQGLDIDGAIPDDVRRGGPLKNPPTLTNYPWEALQGLVMAARVLERYDPELSIWYVGDKAIYRAARLLQVRWEQQFGGWAATGDDMWMLPFLDHAYGTTWSTGQLDEWGAGKNTGWAYVLTGNTQPPPTPTTISDPVPLRLYPSLPNPFTTSTQIRFSLPMQEYVSVRIYDVLGRRVATLFEGLRPPGMSTLHWRGTSASGNRVAHGIYWCQLDVGSRRERIRLTFVH